jgi:hypothetical protein
MFFDIPNKDGLWVYNAASTTNLYQTWVKPTQYNNFIIYACGGGGGGASGQGLAAGNTRFGGGGGCGAGLIVLNTPSYLLPETIYINVGRGGGPGLGGVSTLIQYYANNNTANVLIAANPGGQGSSSTGGNGTVTTLSQSIFSTATTLTSSGANGGIGLSGSNFSITSSCIYGGTGGGGVNSSNVGFAGGNVLASNIHPQLDGGAIASAGNAGYFIKKPFTSLGGTGGGGNPSGTGGTGGNGTWGSGGGGGGGGIIGGTGGRGGDGFVIIIGY